VSNFGASVSRPGVIASLPAGARFSRGFVS
jgi:hypothetical protein